MQLPERFRDSRLAILVSVLAAGAMACRSSSAVTVTPVPATPTARVLQEATPGPTPEGDGPSPAGGHRILTLLDSVSAEKLMAHVEALAAIHTRHVNSQGIGEAATLVRDGFDSAGGRLQVAFDPFPLTFDGLPTTQQNVVATLPGSDPSAGVVVVGAHYDSRTVDIDDASSRAPGADDNAAGVAALLEMARLLADSTPRATIVFIAFSAEEVGTVGSRHYVEAVRQRGDDLRAMMVLDIVGNAVGDTGAGSIRVFSAPPDGSSSRQIARFVALQGQTYLSDFDVLVQSTVDRPGRYSDHVPFCDAGIPSVRLIEAVEDTARQHSGDDLPDTVSPEYLRQATQLALASLVSLAEGPPAPPAPTRLPERPDTLTWEPVSGAVGYALDFRAAGGQEIARVVRVGDVTTLTWDAIGSGRFDAVSVAAIDAEGLMGPLSPELALTP